MITTNLNKKDLESIFKKTKDIVPFLNVSVSRITTLLDHNDIKYSKTLTTIKFDNEDSIETVINTDDINSFFVDIIKYYHAYGKLMSDEGNPNLTVDAIAFSKLESVCERADIVKSLFEKTLEKEKIDNEKGDLNIEDIFNLIQMGKKLKK